jgi:hypothetical protein
LLKDETVGKPDCELVSQDKKRSLPLETTNSREVHSHAGAPGGRMNHRSPIHIRRIPGNRAATIPARSARAFLARPTRFERVTFAFRGLARNPSPLATPRTAVAHARPIG